MAKYLLFVVSFVLIQCSIQKSTHTFNTCFTADPASNNVLQSFDTIISSSAKDGYQAQVDPSSVAGYRKGVIGYWPMDEITAGFTPDNSRQGTHPGQIVGGNINTSGGKFKGGLSLNANGYMLLSAPGPLLPDFAVQYGFTYGLWVKPTAITGTVTIWEQQYIQPALSMTSTVAKCQLHNSTNSFTTASATLSNPLNNWMYMACRYDPVRGLSLCVNGVCSSWTGMTTDVLQSRSSTTTVGARPASPLTGAFTGVLDELMIWNRPLSDDEVAGISAATAQVIPYYGGSFTTVPLNTTDLGIADMTIIDFWEVSPTWTISPIGSSSSDPSVSTTLEISTNGGITWCLVNHGDTLGFNNSICAWPAAHVQFRVTLVQHVVIKCVQLEVTVQPDMSWNYFPLGINIINYKYWSTARVYTDGYKSASSWFCSNKPCVGITFDENWWPVNGVNSTNNPAVLIVNQANFPAGNYTFIAEGEGTVRLNLGCSGIITVNGTTIKTVNCNVKGATSINVIILATNPSNPVRNIRMIFPGMEGIYQTQKYHPLYLDCFNGTYVSRFMDWMDTNGNNMAHWEDRNLQSFAVQRIGKTTNMQISSFVDASASGFNTFLDTKWLVKVTTVGAHQLVRGQQVSIATNPPALVTMKSSTGTNFQANLTTVSGFVDPIDTTSFYVSYALSDWDTNVPSLVSFPANIGGVVSVSVNSGNPYEDMMEYCNAVNSNMWVNIPVVATDDYVTKFATLIRDNLKSNLKVFVEYSNEIWNSDFVQSTIVTQIGLANGLSATGSASDARLRQTVLRTSQILSIFKTVFGETAFNQRIVKLLPSQLSSNMMDILLTLSYNSTLNPGGFTFDGVAGAPYFGYSINNDVHAMYAKNVIPTVDNVLDLTRDALWTDTILPFRLCKQVADKHGVKLFAYEGGPGLVPERGTYRAQQVPLYTEANRHPRMKNIFKHFFYQWMACGADVHVTYTNYAAPSEYGFWGTLEYQDQPLDTAYKYQAWTEVLQLTQGVMPDTPLYVDPNSPSSNSNNGPSSSTNQPGSVHVSSGQYVTWTMFHFVASLLFVF